MQSVQIICVGKLKESYLRDAVQEYTKRLGAFCKLTITEIAEEKTAQNDSAAQIAKAVQKEGEQILAKIKEKSTVFALCIEGKTLSSPTFSQEIEHAAASGGELVFIIGGSFGLSDAVKNRANQKISFSKLTFPHQLFRVMLLEQIYRAYQILGGGKYHK